MFSRESLLEENKKFLFDVKNNPTRYMEFINTMAKFHKYTLPQQINLFFHAPESTAVVASEHIWNDVLQWGLKDEAPYIEILDSESREIEKVYDFRYTKKYEEGTNIGDILWSFNPEKDKELADKIFPGEGELSDRIIDHYVNIAGKYDEITNYHSIAKIQDKELLALTISYIVLKRLGYDAENKLAMNFIMHEWQDFDANIMLQAANSLASDTLDYIGNFINQTRSESHVSTNSIGKSKSGYGSVGESQEEFSPERETGILGRIGETGESNTVPAELPGRIQEEGRTDGGSNPGSGGNTGRTAGSDGMAGLPETDERSEKYGVGISKERGLRDGLDKSEQLPGDIDLSPFDFSADMSSVSGKRAVAVINMAAVQLVKKLENEHRTALPNELKLLKNYRGFGGIPEIFDEFNLAWKKEFTILRDNLTVAEYASIKGSVLNAHFTSPLIIKNIYAALEKMGFHGGNILEPAVGSGRFFEEMPEEMRKNSNLFGIELDSISSRISTFAHQDAVITNQGFEESKFANNSFDVAISNVPFGEYKMRADLPYRDKGMLIHDYFIAKMVDQVRPGGIVAAITSAGTMDKHSSKAREYIAQRAKLLGGLRLPYTAFKEAGTEVTADILFFQKREKMLELDKVNAEADIWIHSNVNEFHNAANDYFLKNPDNVLGVMQRRKAKYGIEWFCDAKPDFTLEESLRSAVENLIPENIYQESTESMPIPVQEKIAHEGAIGLFYEDGRIVHRLSDGSKNELNLTSAEEKLVISTIHIRMAVQDVLEGQRNGCSNEELDKLQKKLNSVYEQHVEKYGRIQQDNKLKKFFDNDPAYPLLRSLEVYDHKVFVKKADIFYTRTINPYIIPDRVDTAEDALKIAVNERGKVDLDFMAQLTGSTREDVINQLEFTSIYYNPEADEYQLADEYLSGDIRQKIEDIEKVVDDLKIRQQEVKDESNVQILHKIENMQRNLQALEGVKPEDLTPADIAVNLGTTWINPSYIKQFLNEELEISSWNRSNIDVEFSQATGEWRISGKNILQNNSKVNDTYGTSGVNKNGKNALELCELALNLREPKVYDTVYIDGTEKRVVNQQATLEARIKQQDLKEAFRKWVWSDEERSVKIAQYYNRHFNNIRPREYNGDFLTFPGMNADITLQKHQKDAIAHTLYGGNTLLAHCVGAGKTFEMIASAMESKRLGIANKSLIVVPKHLTEQIGEDFLKLYPGAKILVATDKTFSAKKREEFCSKIATQDWDAVIMGYTQFEKIPLSVRRQKIVLQEQLNEIIEGINEYSISQGKNSFSVKQLIKMEKKLKSKLQNMEKLEKKDQTVVFEDLGINRLYVDEAHYFKNLYTPTKLGNVSGVQTTEADKTMDFYQKCKYVNEVTNGRGLVFATGTPVSNSMTELYTMQRYLQPERLKASGIGYFDSWAATFGSQVTEMEINPEGQGFRERTKFARFQNLPELMSIFKEVADIKTADMLNLPRPDEKIIVERLRPSEIQIDYVNNLAERAKQVRDKVVDSSVDNMLKITNEGRLLALDQRIMRPETPDDQGSKVNKCIDNVLAIYNATKEDKSTQLIFCDKSTPNKNGKFSVYDDIKAKLIRQGVSEDEIAFIHDAATDVQKDILFEKVRSGQVRILLGSTDKMGVGTNVQDKLIATHDLDVPWRPSDLEQRKGRISRRGNTNKDVKIYRYITEGTFDAYMWQILENKQRFISQIMTSKAPTRTSEDCDEITLSYAEVKACATGNPLIKEKMDIDNQVKRLEIDKSNYLTAHDKLKHKCQIEYPLQIKSIAGYIEKLQAMKIQVDKSTMKVGDKELFSLELDGKTYIDKKEAAEALLEAAKGNLTEVRGHYKGLAITMWMDKLTGLTNVVLSYKANLECQVSIGKMDHAINGLGEDINFQSIKLKQLQHDFKLAQQELAKPFEKEELLREKIAVQKKLELEIQSAMDDEDHKINMEHKQRLMAIQALFDDEDFRPERLPEDTLERAFMFKAALLYLENGKEWGENFENEIYIALVEKFDAANENNDQYDCLSIADVIVKNSPSVPSCEDLAAIMDKYSKDLHIANNDKSSEYSEVSLAVCR